jgi:hypothetical protein
MASHNGAANTAWCRRPWPPTFEPAEALWAMSAAQATVVLLVANVQSLDAESTTS